MPRPPALLSFLLLTGCGLDTILAYPVGQDDSGEADTGPSDGGAGDGGEPDGGGGDGGGADGGGDADGGGGGADGGGGAAAFEAGDLVISELMINPDAVADESGEWIELYNNSGRALDLDGLVLSDEGVDTWILDGGVRVAAGDWVVLCADTAPSANGGTACDGAFNYNTWGEGFALANAADEVLLSTGEGLLIDRVSYLDGTVQAGESLSLDPDKLNASANDSPGAWCSRVAPTPGRANPDC